jgi:hypothetical protein
MDEPYLTLYTLTNPTVAQLRAATQIVARRRVENGIAVDVLLSRDIANHILKLDAPPFQPVVIG